MQCEATGLPYMRDTSLMVTAETEALAVEYEAKMIELKQMTETVSVLYDKLKAGLYDAMVKNGVSEVLTPLLKITLTRPTTRNGFDSKRFQAEHKDLYEEYKTNTPVKGHVTIKIRENE